MERKYVYLFELDSVRLTDEDIILGQRKLYDEIVHEGNMVVLTYNQLVDSRAFFSLLSVPSYYESFMKLFEKGCIRISQYGDVRTITQYLLDAMDEDKQFIFSALPLKFTQKRLIALVRRSLMYSDLSELYEYFEGGRRSDDELRDLFLEVKCDKEGNVLSVAHVDGQKSLEEMRLVIHNLYHFLSLVLRLSAMHGIYIPPRKPEEIRDLRLHQILSCALKLDVPELSLWKEAVRILEELPCFLQESDGRSVYYRQLLEAAENGGNVIACRLAEGAVDLCYNYACEISICNTSKHYNVNELLQCHGERPSFAADFENRLRALWNGGKNSENRFLNPESDTFTPFQRIHEIPDFREAVRTAGYTSYATDFLTVEIPRYEYKELEQREEQKRQVWHGIGKKLAFSFLCFFIACLVELGMQGIQNILDDYIDLNDIVSSIIETLAFLFLTELVSAVISRRWPGFLSLSQALGGMKTLLHDALHVYSPTAESKVHPVQVNIKESRSGEAPIDFVRTKEIKSYLAYQKKYGHEVFFADSSVCPIAATDDEGTLRQVIRNAEIYHHRYGLIYRSPFNTLLVDPIVGEKGAYYPFERVIPTAGNGVVMAVRFGEKFILLSQFRHALRAKQYSFPRGYAEPGDSPLKNVQRELKEELDATVTKPPLSLGFIEPDSGLTSRRIEVFLVDVDSYTKKEGYEGIQDVMELTLSELKQWISEGKISDGYTLGAVELMEGKLAIRK